MKKVRNCRLSFRLFGGGHARLRPVLVLRAQLLCLPLPFTPANGFSWNNTQKSWRSAMRSITSINSMLWSCGECWLPQTAGPPQTARGNLVVRRVRTGMPRRIHSCSEIQHKGRYAARDRTEVVVSAAVGRGPESGRIRFYPASPSRTGLEQGLVNQKIFLFGTQRSGYAGYVFVKPLAYALVAALSTAERAFSNGALWSSASPV